MHDSTGRTFSITAGSPPIIRVDVPAIACSTVLPTGLSSIAPPFAATLAPMRRVVSGSIVLMST